MLICTGKTRLMCDRSRSMISRLVSYRDTLIREMPARFSPAMRPASSRPLVEVFTM